MDKVYCKIVGVLNVLKDVGAVLDVEYQSDPRYSWDEVSKFLKAGKFNLKFQGPEGIVTLRDVTVSTATSLTDQPGILVALGQNEPSRIPPGCTAWIEKG